MTRSSTSSLRQSFEMAVLWPRRSPVLAYALLLVLCMGFIYAGGHDDQRMLQLVFLFMGACVLACRPLVARIVPRLGQGIAWPLAAFFSLGILSSIRALSPTFAAYETASLFLLLLLALAIAHGLAKDSASIAEVVRMFALVACIYAFKIVAVYASVWLLHATPETIDFTPGFSNIRHLNHVQTVGLPLLALAYLQAPSGSRWRLLFGAGAAMWWTLLLVTSGRGTAMGLFAGALVAFAMCRRAAVPLLRTLLIGCVSGAIVYGLFFWLLPVVMGLPPFGRFGGLVGRTLANPDNHRTELWKCALNLIHEHPGLGAGPMHFAHYALPIGNAAHPHNWMLQIGAEWGLPALIMVCIALYFAGRGLWRAGARLAADDTANQTIFAAWILIGTAVLVDGMVSGNIVMPQSQLTIVFYIACATGWAWSFSRQSIEPRTNAIADNGMRIATVIAALCLAIAIAPVILDKAINGTASASSTSAQAGHWWIRLWMDTRF